jgi:hypothetical protein
MLPWLQGLGVALSGEMLKGESCKRELRRVFSPLSDQASWYC